MSHEALRPTFKDLIDPEAQLDRIWTGFAFTEGPVWHPLDHYLLFSDMPGDVRRRWDPEHGVAEVRRPANKCNGMTYDADLNLIVCEHATSMLVRERAICNSVRFSLRARAARRRSQRLDDGVSVGDGCNILHRKIDRGLM